MSVLDELENINFSKLSILDLQKGSKNMLGYNFRFCLYWLRLKGKPNGFQFVKLICYNF